MATEIKICGLTAAEDVKAVNAAGADYAGFVLYAPSRRHVTLDAAVALKGRLAPGIRSVAVCVDPDEMTLAAIDRAGFDRIQIHGRITPDLLAAVRTPVWQAVNLSGPERLAAITDHPRLCGYVIDGAAFGGGRTFGWEQAGEAPQCTDGSGPEPAGGIRTDPLREEIRRRIGAKQFILAGGLTVENVREGIRLFSPDAVDVSSGVEWSAEGRGNGRKDPERIAAFVREVRD